MDLEYLEGYLVAISHEEKYQYYISEYLYNWMAEYNETVYPVFTLPTLLDPQPTPPAVG